MDINFLYILINPLFWGLLIVGLIIRLIPALVCGKKSGVDYWYWKMYIEKYKETKKFPPDLPLYRLEPNQWSPPIFPLLVSPLSKEFLDRYGWIYGFVIDLFRMAMALIAIIIFTNNNTLSAILCGLAYATSPNLVTYNFQLNPRGLSGFFLDLALLFSYGWIVMGGSYWYAVLVSVSFALVLLSHKMTTQLFYFMSLFLTIATQNILFLLLTPLSIVLALLMSKGFYWSVFKSNIQAIRFWSKQWPVLLADPLKESPVYGIKGYVTPGKQFKSGIKNYIVRFFSIFFGNYSPWVTLALLLTFLVPPITELEMYIRFWFWGCMLFSVITVVIPSLRGLGFGNLYLYNAIFPGSLYMGLVAVRGNTYLLPLFGLFLLFNLFILIRTVLHLKKQMGIAIPDPVINKIKNCTEGVWLSFPLTLIDRVAYLTQKPVLWGSHCGWDLMDVVYPVLRKSFEELKKQYKLKYILAQGSHVKYLEGLSFAYNKLYSSGDFCIYEITD